MWKVGSGSLCSDGPSDAAEGAKAENRCSEAQSTDRMPAPSVVPFHPFKTQRGGKAGIPSRREGVEVLTRHHSRQSSVRALRAGGVLLATGAQQIQVRFSPVLPSVGPVGATVVEEPWCL